MTDGTAETMRRMWPSRQIAIANMIVLYRPMYCRVQGQCIVPECASKEGTHSIGDIRAEDGRAVCPEAVRTVRITQDYAADPSITHELKVVKPVAVC